MSGIKIFVSVGRTSTPRQEEFVSAIESHMRAQGLEPLALGRNYYSSQQPLKAIDALMSECSGVAIVAFERVQIVQGVERRGSELECQLADVPVPSVWNHIEAAMAYTRRLPLLVLVQERLRLEGLLEPGYDWYVKRLPLEARAVEDREFCGIVDDWRARVEDHHAARVKSKSSEGVSQLGSSPTMEAKAVAEPGFNRRQLRLILEQRFSDEELRELCFDLGVDYENMSGATKTARIIAIITYFERMQRSQELIRTVTELRPDDMKSNAFK